MTENAPQLIRHIIVEGRVQGVGYRWFARERGRRMGLRGSVQNRPDGSVEIHVSGSETVLARFLTDLSVGPEGADVSRIAHVEIASATTGATTRATAGANEAPRELPFPFAILK